MESLHSLPGLVRTIFFWLPDAFAMPTRIRRLNEAAKADSDPRPVCLKCGAARVSVTDSTPTNGVTIVFGRCESTVCGQRWRMDHGLKTLHSPVHG